MKRNTGIGTNQFCLNERELKTMGQTITCKAAMPSVLPTKDRMAGWMSNFLDDHHKALIEIKVVVARIRWSSCQNENIYDLLLK